MPKHQANLDFVTGTEWASSQYDLDGKMASRFDLRRPKSAWLPLNMGALNYCEFRGMIMKSTIYFNGKTGVRLLQPDAAEAGARRSPARGNHPRARRRPKTAVRGPHPVGAGRALLHFRMLVRHPRAAAGGAARRGAGDDLSTWLQRDLADAAETRSELQPRQGLTMPRLLLLNHVVLLLCCSIDLAPGFRQHCCQAKNVNNGSKIIGQKNYWLNVK